MASPERLLSLPNSTSELSSSYSQITEVPYPDQTIAKSMEETSVPNSGAKGPLITNTPPPLRTGEGEPRNLPIMTPSTQHMGLPTTPIPSTTDTPRNAKVSAEVFAVNIDHQSKISGTGESTSANFETLSPEATHVATSTAPQASIEKSAGKPIVVGIYGVSGCGKSYLLKQLKHILREIHYAFYDGSAMLEKVTPGGLDAFKKLDKKERERYRTLAIQTIRNECLASGKLGIVAGHYMFWRIDEKCYNIGKADRVWTRGDAKTFTHIIYLDVPTDIILKQCRDDEERKRAVLPEMHIREWQMEEKAALKRVCPEHGILFSVLARDEQLPSKAAKLLRNFKECTEELNLPHALLMLNAAIGRDSGKLETMLVLDADRTLCAVDAGEMFWTELGRTDHPLKDLFSSPMQYTHNAFRQASLLYEEATDDAKFTSICRVVASKVKIHPEFVKLLRRIAPYSHVSAVLLTCGLRLVWEMVLQEAGFVDTIKVIGGGRVDNGYVVTAEVKAALVKQLREKHNIYVWAFGDSPLDLPMLKEADEAIVVVGEAGKQSKTMDKKLSNAIEKDGLVARQVLLPKFATPRLDTAKLPALELSEAMKSMLRRRERLTVLYASPSAAQLLQTPMRNAENEGITLQAAHEQVGWFLATELVTEAIGLEEYPMPHVQGSSTPGHRLLYEGNTTIVALMRGGDPMARGVHRAFPSAMFVHANAASDLKPEHLEHQKTILLVDSVINNGTTIVEFVKRIKRLGSDARIVVVTGVAQKGSVADNGPLARVGREGLTIVALRLSENKYTGQGGTDTGNRLFNTTRLD